MLRSSTKRMVCRGAGMILVISLIAIKNRVQLSGEPCRMPFCWTFVSERVPAALTLKVRPLRKFCKRKGSVFRRPI